ncbi:Abi family protein [Paenibacillus zanthoxyli]|uniref:Abi family protein n=1 Tax=Paenibacillus zanthoxyli TaxID=369399 RepID=UPI0004BCD254|nr:Abi family protein [Paenibacillus zanthoxyli]
MDQEISHVKAPATFEQQIEILRSRGLIIDNEDLAIRTLQRVNYYRLTAYGLSLKRDDRYNPGVTFSRICALYEFDHQFRYLLMDMTEQIEIAFRTHISYLIAHKYGALGYLDGTHFENSTYHSSFLNELNKEFKRSQEIFIKHHFEKYNGIIPIWVAVEVLSFGALSKLFKNMKNEDKNQIARSNYYIPAIYLESWLQCLSYVRNICAHYGRLYNRPLTSKPRLSSHAKKLGIQQNKIFAHLFALKHLIPDYEKWTDFITRLEALITKYKEVVELDRIGFPEDWEALLISRRQIGQ